MYISQHEHSHQRKYCTQLRNAIFGITQQPLLVVRLVMVQLFLVHLVIVHLVIVLLQLVVVLIGTGDAAHGQRGC